MRKSLRVTVASSLLGLVGAVAVATAAPAFAAPPEGPADRGLMNAVERVNANAATRGANWTWGTRNAACNSIVDKNPSISNELSAMLTWSCATHPAIHP